MELFRTVAPIWVLVFPLICALFLALLPFASERLAKARRPEFERAAYLLTPAAAIAVALFLIVARAATGSQASAEANFRWTPDRFQMRLRLDGASEVFGALLCLVFAASSLKQGVGRGGSGGAALAALGCGLGALMATDMVALIFFWLLMALLCSWPALEHEAGGAFLCWMAGAILLAALSMLGFASIARTYHIPSAGVSLIGREVELLAPSGLGVALAFFLGAVVAAPRSMSGGIGGAMACAVVAPGYVLLRVAHELLPAYAGGSLTGVLAGLGLSAAALAGIACVLTRDFTWKARLCIASQAGFWSGWMAQTMGASRRPGLPDMAAYLVVLGSLACLLEAWAGATQDRPQDRETVQSVWLAVPVVIAAACAVVVLPLLGFSDAPWIGTGSRWLGVVGLGAAAACAASFIEHGLARGLPGGRAEGKLAILWAAVVLLALLLRPFMSAQLGLVFVERLPVL